MDLYIALLCICIFSAGLFWWLSFKPPVIKRLMYIEEQLDLIEQASGKKANYIRRSLPIQYLIRFAIAVGLLIYFSFYLKNVTAGVLSFILFLVFIHQKNQLAERARSEKIEKETEIALRQLASHYETSGDFLLSLQRVAQHTQPPLKQEFEQVIAEVNMSKPLLSALLAMAERLNNKDLKVFVKGAVQSEQMGTNTAEVINMISELIRERIDLKEELRTESKGQNTTIKVFLSIIPLSLIAISFFPSAVQTLRYSGAGQFTLVFLIIVQYAAWYFSHKGEVDI